MLGVDADARAYLLVRAYCGGAVKVMVADDGRPGAVLARLDPPPGNVLAASLGARAVQD